MSHVTLQRLLESCHIAATNASCQMAKAYVSGDITTFNATSNHPYTVENHFNGLKLNLS